MLCVTWFTLQPHLSWWLKAVTRALRWVSLWPSLWSAVRVTQPLWMKATPGPGNARPSDVAQMASLRSLLQNALPHKPRSACWPRFLSSSAFPPTLALRSLPARLQGAGPLSQSKGPMQGENGRSAAVHYISEKRRRKLAPPVLLYLLSFPSFMLFLHTHHLASHSQDPELRIILARVEFSYNPLG